VEGNAGFGATNPHFANGRLDYGFPFRMKGFAGQFELGGLAGSRPSQDGKYARLDGRVLLQRNRTGLWVGVARRKDDAGDPTSSTLFGLGSSLRVGDFLPALGLEQTPDKVAHIDYHYRASDSSWSTTQSQEAIRRTTVHAGVGWSRGRVALESVLGLSLSPEGAPRKWLRGDAALNVVSGLSLVAAAGSSAPDLFGAPENHKGQATLGIRLNPSWSASRIAGGREGDSPEWRVVEEKEGWYTLEVRARDASLVEITTDASGWVPTALVRMAHDRWRIRMRLQPGIYHVNLRIDGGPWIVPPGAPTVPDEWLGSTGVLIVGG